MYALDPVLFAADRLGFTAPDPWQAAFLRASDRQTLLNCHRQAGKSTAAAILALHRVWFYPGSLVLLVSPSLRQSGELFKKVVDYLDMLPERPKRLPEDNKLSFELPNRSRVVSLPGSEGTIRGFSKANLLIEDESAQVDDSTYKASRPFLAISRGQLVLMSTPHGQRGHYYDTWTKGGKDWKRVEVPVSKCKRIPAAFLAGEKRALGEMWYRQEYLCEFLGNTYSIFSPELIDALVSDKVKAWD
jgi:hypothetical protein